MRHWLQGYGAILTTFDRRGLKAWRTRSDPATAALPYCAILWPALMRRFATILRTSGWANCAATSSGFTSLNCRLGGRDLAILRRIGPDSSSFWKSPNICSPDGQSCGCRRIWPARSPRSLEKASPCRRRITFLREDRLADGLAFVCAEAGVEMLPLPAMAEREPFRLAELYGPDLEGAARDVYGRDYTAFGFGNWR